jgi:signal transduction histidine kinase/ligand-binding sensor domain-containing protein
LLALLALLSAAPAQAAPIASPPPSSVHPSARAALPPAPPGQAGRDADFPFAEPFFESINQGDAIPEGIVSALVQDGKGMLWLGTQGGLMRYDGYRFHTFAHHADDPRSIAFNHISCLWLAADGRLWIGGSISGLSVYDPGQDRFTNYLPDATRKDGFSGQDVTAIVGDANGGIWVGTREDGLNYLAPGSNGFRHYRHAFGDARSLQDDRIRSLLFDRKGRLWVGGANGLQRLRADKSGFERIAPKGLDGGSPVGSGVIRALFEAQDGKLWVGTEAGAAWIDPASGQWHALPQAGSASPGIVAVIAQPRPDQIWLGQRNSGIAVVSAEDGHLLQSLHHDPSIASSLGQDGVATLLHDNAGLLWVGTLGGGLQRLNLRTGAFRMLHHSPLRPEGLSHANVAGVLELSNGQILVGSNGNGIDIIDRQRGLIGGYRAQPGNSGSLLDAAIFALAQTSDGAIWAGTQRGGVFRLSPNSQRWQNFSMHDGLPDNRIRCLVQTRDGELWVGTDRGLAHWQAARRQFETVPTTDGSVLRTPILMMAEDQEGRLWLGTNVGLWLREAGAAAIQGIVHDRADKSSLSDNSIGGLLVDHKGRLWVDSGQGLERLLAWDGKVAQFEHVSARLGQASLIFDGNMLEDQRGRIWSHRMMYDPTTQRLVPIGKADGMSIGTSWTGSYGKTRDGLFLFGGTQGLAIVKPEYFDPWDFQPQVVVSELKIDGVSQSLGLLQSGLRLQAPQRNFAMEFSALDFSAPQQSRYMYRLQGFEQKWIKGSAEHRIASYGNLWPGDYLLEVRATNRSGAWSPFQLEVPIRVLPALWQTGWFMTLMLVMLCSLIYVGYRWRISRVRARARETQFRLRSEAMVLQQLVQSRTADILKLGTIGQELTATLNTEQAFERVYRQISARLDTWVFSIGIYDEANQIIRIGYLIENGQRLAGLQYAMSEHDRPAVWCVREQRELIAGTPDELLRYVSTILPAKSGALMASIVYLPLIAEQRVIGCLSVQSPEPHAYSEDQIKFLHVLASYTAIAVANSEAHNALASAHQRLQATQQQLVLQEKMAGLGTLTAGVAHEINNPTNFAHVAAQNLRVDLKEFRQFATGLIDADDAPEILQAFTERFDKLGGHISTMLQGTERIKGIVRDLRAFTRLEQAEKKVMRLSECLSSTLNLVRTSWQHQILFVTAIVDDPALECWPALLNQVFMNLLINGCQAIVSKQGMDGAAMDDTTDADPLKGQITIRMHIVGPQLTISFIDNGIGMSAEIQARILEPFFTTKPVGEGTGLGLSIAYGIILQHGGTLDISSTPGEGSCFTIGLPLGLPLGTPLDGAQT